MPANFGISLAMPHSPGQLQGPAGLFQDKALREYSINLIVALYETRLNLRRLAHPLLEIDLTLIRKQEVHLHEVAVANSAQGIFRKNFQ